MRTQLFKIITIISVIIQVLPSHSQSGDNPDRLIRGYNLQIENDMFIGSAIFRNEDKDYSGGFHFGLYTDYLNVGLFPMIKNRNEDRNEDQYFNFNMVYVEGMGFSPNRDAFGETDVVTGQRPYASLIGVGRKRIAVWDGSTDNEFYGLPIRISIESDLFLGALGSDGPGKFQNWIHKNISNSPQVEGWHNQIGHGGRLAFKYRIQPSIGLLKIGKVNAYLLTHGTFGTVFNNVGFGLSITNRDIQSMGLFNALGSNKLNPFMENGGVSYPNFCSRISWDVYFRSTVVLRNTLLEGYHIQDNSVYTIPGSDLSDLVTDFGGRIMLNAFLNDHKGSKMMVRHNTFFFEFIIRTKEFKGHDVHAFGNVGFTVFML